ncbi:MAG: peptide-methionine (R)-S-oxide reductase, partial [Saprospiraceae bacterium]|nr:peptide-methionine (R)-S-oxide reductase [Saprospiraceae bacterium]
MKNSIQLVLLLSLFACHTATKQQDMQTDTSSIRATMTSAVDTVKPIEKSDAEWKAELTPQEYYVLREKGTERAFSGDLWDYHGDGIFVCAACGLPLFDSHTKFE